MNDSVAASPSREHPDINDIDQWVESVGEGGDPNQEWRVFFAHGRLNCAACHRFQGRGSQTGPDLTGIVKRTSRPDVLESKLKPRQNLAPHYVPVFITLTDGRMLTGLWIGHDKDGNRELFQDAEGKIFSVDPNEIEERKPAKLSIMPDDLHKRLSVEDIRHLLGLREDE